MDMRTLLQALQPWLGEPARAWRSWRARREAAVLRRRAIPDDLWKRTLVRHPFLRRRSPEDMAELRRLTSLFLDRKEFSTAAGLRLSDMMAVTVAAQAVLPVLHLGLARYDGFVGIVLHADAVRAPREQADEDGVVHAWEEPLAGEAMQGGPLMLSWRDVRLGGHRGSGPAYNVVIHEFAHVLDMEDGLADGVPVLPAELSSVEWAQALQTAYLQFQQRLGQEAGADTRSGEGPKHGAGALDPYAATGPEEFFAVASESFFVTPRALQAQHPGLYDVFRRFYRQDPATEPGADQPPASTWPAAG
jgi:Mlc titration factor MtfA (ptsG expression regulator)